jgi:glutamate 5-kinase
MLEVEKVEETELSAVRSRFGFARNVIVKLGSNVLVGGGSGVINRRVFCSLVEQMADLGSVGNRTLTLVSSGAVALGRRTLESRTQADATSLRRTNETQTVRPESLARKQALASIGQPLLMNLYAQEFAFYGLSVAQVLLSRDDFAERERFLNARNTFRELSDTGRMIPVVNENDTVSTHEIRFGDNDALAALLTSVVGADLLIILSDVPALYTDDPARNTDATRIAAAWSDDRNLAEMNAAPAGSTYGTGGMASKVKAARMAGTWGVPTVVAAGREPEILRRILRGDDVGTVFMPRNTKLAARKAWLRFATRPSGVVSIDRGAETAVRELGKSLLPRGITGISGDFQAGGAVGIVNEEGLEIARGLACYGAADLKRLIGLRSEQIFPLLGYHNGDEAIHRDDLVLMEDFVVDPNA